MSELLGRCDKKQYEHCGPHPKYADIGQRLPPFGCVNWKPDVSPSPAAGVCPECKHSIANFNEATGRCIATDWDDSDRPQKCNHRCVFPPAPEQKPRRWQHDETGRICDSPQSPGERWVEVPASEVRDPAAPAPAEGDVNFLTCADCFKTFPDTDSHNCAAPQAASPPERTIDKLHRETGIPMWALEIAFELSTNGMLDEETMAGLRVIPDTARIIAARAALQEQRPTTPLLQKIVEICDSGSAQEFGDADERLRAIRGLIIGENV